MDVSQLVDCFRRTIKSSVEIVKLCKFNPNNSKQHIMRLLLESQISTATTIFKLLNNIENPFFDFQSVASLTRNVLHNFKPYYYLAVDNVSDDEYEVRYLVYKLYEYSEYNAICEFLNDPSEKSYLEAEIIKTQQELEQNAFFQSLRTNLNTIYGTLYQKIIKNKPISCTFRESLARNEGCFIKDASLFSKFFLELNYVKTAFQKNPNLKEEDVTEAYDCFYKYLSNHVHASAFALFEQASNWSVKQKPVLITTTISCNIFYVLLSVEQALEKCGCVDGHERHINAFLENLEGTEPFADFMLKRILEKQKIANSVTTTT